ncbi:Ubiquinone biosynthesis O-methyltransferase, mitochondrial [Candidatus Entotheonellaceae bacterium PAL068K]
MPGDQIRHWNAVGADVAASLRRSLRALATRRPRPCPFVDIDGLPWADPAFSRHFLRTATRRPHHTRREIAFLERSGVLAPGRRILDLACGGGRHSLAMARYGAVVTGIDVGPATITAARRRARRAGLSIEFEQGDLRCLEYDGIFDAVTFLFGCFTEMPRAPAQDVLRRISRSLRPGGLFVLDVYTPCFFADLDGRQEWWVAQDFIAGRFPQLVLTEYFYYPHAKTYARRDFICNPATGNIHTFGVSGQAYTLPELYRMFEAVDLIPVMTVSGWQGEEVTAESPLFILLASKAFQEG